MLLTDIPIRQVKPIDKPRKLLKQARERFAEFGGNWVALHAETRMHRVEDHVP
jgi:hypothetical protein